MAGSGQSVPLPGGGFRPEDSATAHAQGDSAHQADPGLMTGAPISLKGITSSTGSALSSTPGRYVKLVADVDIPLRDHHATAGQRRRGGEHPGARPQPPTRCALLDRLQPTLPMLAANLASIAPVLITYRADLEQLLVLLPLATAMMKAIDVPNAHNPSQYAGADGVHSPAMNSSCGTRSTAS